jgi:hypothetical protein
MFIGDYMFRLLVWDTDREDTLILEFYDSSIANLLAELIEGEYSSFDICQGDALIAWCRKGTSDLWLMNFYSMTGNIGGVRELLDHKEIIKVCQDQLCS